jgi:biopolymer transport protein TolR
MSFGRLERTQGTAPMSDINMTPLVDVMLVLVVIFILTAPLMVSTVKVELPQTQGASADEPPKAMMLVIDKAGQVYVNDQPVDMATLAETLGKTGRDDPSTEVQLKADAAVPYGRVVEVMGLAHQAGLSRIGFVADPGAVADH